MHRFHSFFLVFGVSILTINLAGCAKKFDPLLAKAHKSFQQKSYVETIDALSLALRSWRESDGTEKKAEASQLLGKAYKEIGKYDKAMENFAAATELSTNTFDSAYTLGQLYLTASQPHDAIRWLKSALKMKKDDPMALVLLGNAYFDIGDFPQAKVAYQRVLDTSPGVSTALESLAIIERKTAQARKSKKMRRR